MRHRKYKNIFVQSFEILANAIFLPIVFIYNLLKVKPPRLIDRHNRRYHDIDFEDVTYTRSGLPTYRNAPPPPPPKKVKVINQYVSKLIENTNTYLDSLATRDLEQAKKILAIGMTSSKGSLTKENVHQLKMCAIYKDNYIPRQVMEEFTLPNEINIISKNKYKGEIPNEVVDKIYDKTRNKFLFRCNSYGNSRVITNHDSSILKHIRYDFHKEKLKKGEILRISTVDTINNVLDSGYYLLDREDFILNIKETALSFEEFKNDTGVNKAETSIYITKVIGGYIIIENW